MSVADVLSLLAVGVLAGLMAGVMGLGGGTPVVLWTILVLGYGQHLAQGTALFVMIPTALVAAYAHHRNGLVQWRWAIALSAGGVVGALVGSWSALAIRGPVLRYLFVAFLGVLALRTIQMGMAKVKAESQE